jgi:hypothetical protein
MSDVGKILQIATNPSEHPTAMSVGESHVKHEETLDGDLASKTGDWILTRFRAR